VLSRFVADASPDGPVPIVVTDGDVFSMMLTASRAAHPADFEHRYIEFTLRKYPHCGKRTELENGQFDSPPAEPPLIRSTAIDPTKQKGRKAAGLVSPLPSFLLERLHSFLCRLPHVSSFRHHSTAWPRPTNHRVSRNAHSTFLLAQSHFLDYYGSLWDSSRLAIRVGAR